MIGGPNRHRVLTALATLAIAAAGATAAGCGEDDVDNAINDAEKSAEDAANDLDDATQGAQDDVEDAVDGGSGNQGDSGN